MAANADSVVVELIAENNKFDAAVKSSANAYQQGMKQIEASGAAAESSYQRLSASVGSSRIAMMEFQHVARGASDQIAAGTPLTQILTQHMGQLSQAASLAGGSLGKFSGFLGGPWGIALTLATVVLSKLTFGHKDAEASVDSLVGKLREHYEQAKLNEQATAAWLRTYEGASENIKKVTDAIAAENRTLEENISLKQGELRANIATEQKSIADAQRGVATARAQIAQLRKQPGARDPDDPNYLNIQGLIAQQQRQIDALNAQISGASAAIARAQLGIKQAVIPLIEQQAKALADPVEGIRQKYAGLQDTAEKAALGNKAALQRIVAAFSAAGQKIPTTLRDTLAALDKLEKKETDAARAAEKAGRSTSQFGRQISFADASAIAKSAGLNVTSAYRSTAHQAELYNDPHYNHPGNPVARPGTSAHEGVNGKWALDIAFAPGLTPAKLQKLYGDQGVSLSAIYKESGHYHIEGSRSQAASAESAAQRAVDKAAKDAAQRAQQAAEQAAAYQTEIDRLGVEFIDAKRGQIKDELALADLAEDQIRAEQQKRDDGYRAAAVSHRLTQAQADQLIAVNATVAAEKIRAVETQKRVELIRREDAAAERTAQYRQDDLKAAEAGATSQAERRDLDLQILDILYDEKLAHLERLKLIAEGNGDLQAANDLQSQIDRLPSEKANDRAQTIRGTMDPLESWLQSVPHDAQAVEEALQGIAVNGFDNISSSIADVITGTKSLGSAFSDIAKQIIGDIIQMTVKMLIFRALSSVLGGAFGGGSSNVLSSGIYDGVAGIDGLRAAGGPVRAGGAYIVGEQGPELFVPGSSGTIVPNNATAASPWSGGQPSVVHVLVEASPYFDGRVIEVAGPVIAQAGARSAYGGAAIARNGLAKRHLHQLGSRG